MKQSVYSNNVFGSLVGFNSRWGYIVSIFDFDWGSNNILIVWGCNQDWGFNRADTVGNSYYLSLVAGREASDHVRPLSLVPRTNQANPKIRFLNSS